MTLRLVWLRTFSWSVCPNESRTISFYKLYINIFLISPTPVYIRSCSRIFLIQFRLFFGFLKVRWVWILSNHFGWNIFWTAVFDKLGKSQYVPINFRTEAPFLRGGPRDANPRCTKRGEEIHKEGRRQSRILQAPQDHAFSMRLIHASFRAHFGSKQDASFMNTYHAGGKFECWHENQKLKSLLWIKVDSTKHKHQEVFTEDMGCFQNPFQWQLKKTIARR